MRKLVLLILFVTVAQVSIGQQVSAAISFTIANPRFTTDNSFLFDVFIKNNSDSTLYIIKPESRFFDITYKDSDILGMYGLKKYPYQLTLHGGKDCVEEGPARIAFSQSGSQFELLRHLIRISPKTTEVFKNIKLTLTKNYPCKGQPLDVQLKYSPEFSSFDKLNVSTLSKQLERVMQEAAALDNLLPFEVRWMYLSGSENFRNMNDFISVKLPSLKRLNGKTFISTQALPPDEKDKFVKPDNYETFTHRNDFSISYPNDWKRRESAFIAFSCSLIRNETTLATVAASIREGTTYENRLAEIFSFYAKRDQETTSTKVSDYDAVSFFTPTDKTKRKRHLLVRLSDIRTIHFTWEYPANDPALEAVTNSIEKSIVILR